MDDNERLFKLAGVFMISGHAFAFSDMIGLSRQSRTTASPMTTGNGQPAMVTTEQVVVCLTSGTHVAITPTEESVDAVIARWVAYRTEVLGVADAAARARVKAEAGEARS